MLQFNCPHCGKAIRLKEEFAGRKGACPHCKKPMQAPAAAPPPRRPQPEPEPEYVAVDDAYEDAAAEEPVIARRETAQAKGKKKKKQSSSQLPLIIGGGVGVVALIIGLVVWLVMSGSGKPTEPAKVANTAPPPAVNATPPAAGAPAKAQPAVIAAAPSARSEMFAYLPPGLEAMAGIRVAEALKSPEHKVLIKAQLDSTLRPVLAQTGLALNQLDEIVMGTGTRADELLIAVRAAQPVDAAAIRTSLGCTAAAQKINQFDLYPLPPDPDAAESVACFMDAKTFLLGSKVQVQKALEASSAAQTPAVLKSVTEVAGVKTHLWVVARMSVLKSQVGQLTGLGVAESLFAPSLDKIGQVAMGYDLTKGLQLRVALECGTEGEAKLVRNGADALRVAIRDAEKKSAEIAKRGSAPGGPQGGAQPPGGPGAQPPGGPGAQPPGGPGAPGGPPGGRAGGPGGGAPPAPGGALSGGGITGGAAPGAGGGDRAAGSVWDATEVKQAGNQVLVTLPPVKVEGERGASPLDLFDSATQAGLARSAVGSPLFPGSLRRTSLALRKLEQQDGTIPAGTIVVAKYPRPIQRVSWLASLLPYLGQQDLHDQIDFAEQWTDKKNIPAAVTIVDAFLDPLVPQRRWKGLPFEGVALTHYAGMGGVGVEGPTLPKDHPKAGIFGYERKTALADVKDGVSNTIMMIQVRDVFGPWIQGGGATVRAAQSQPYIGATSGFGSPGDTGAMTIFADGSVRFLSKDIDSKVFEALCTINGGETVDLSKFAEPAKPPAGPPLVAQSQPPAGSSPAGTSGGAKKGSAGSELTVYEKPKEGFAVGLPAAWKEIDMDPQNMDAALKSLEQQNPQLGPQVSASVRAVAKLGFKFYGCDLQSAATVFMRNVNVMKNEIPIPLTLDQVVEQNLQQFESLPFVVKPVKHERMKGAFGEAERVQFGVKISAPGAPSINSDSILYLFVKDKTIYSLTVSVATGEASQHLALADKIAQSFRILN